MLAPSTLPATPSTDEPGGGGGSTLKLCHHARVAACPESAIVTSKLSAQCVQGKSSQSPGRLGRSGQVSSYEQHR